MTTQVMNASSPSETRRTNQFKLIGIFAIAGIPVVMAMLMYFGNFAVPSGKTNKGVLLDSPMALSDLGFERDARNLYMVNDGKWLIMQTGFGACEESCKEMLFNARQVNVLMGREQERVGRLFVGTPESLTPNISEEYPMLQTQQAAGALESFYQKAGLTDQSWHLWIVDPNGNIILRYDGTHSGYDLRDDLKKLLKLSNIG